ncbi:hypothetical protein HJG60_010863 [Phyllostomus discolor]|uniref:Uncharacterized protein n=1 Tax=Phyllostomus discolor TaxID=89673 RepID=A0A834AHI0_9CHIR|nr:hypothetical protein HJG60_010863 [Phyllostomus discolor]
MARKPEVLRSDPAGVWAELSMAEGDGGERPAVKLVSEAATKASLDAPGYIPAHVGSLEHRGKQTVGLEIPTQEFLLLSPHMRQACISHSFPPSPLAIWAWRTKGNQHRGKWVSDITVWERQLRSGRKEIECTERNDSLAVQVHIPFLQMTL